ncbi:LOW QUALITY PROTEIN: centromere protein T [Neopsephotus bourkii]|uniref:LOW QUALITY PROTEIN: centromere protein T n=1 Tax=Neopsephotus bourkii TaxID=309878 RepID=UPI002AA50E77|nr:LOW QUALITY PROTEIN: centromere protein T [Neopsephotus bourkii]
MAGRGETAAGGGGVAELQLPQGQPRPLAAGRHRPPRPHRNYADHNAPRRQRRRNYPPHTALFPRPRQGPAHSREALRARSVRLPWAAALVVSKSTNSLITAARLPEGPTRSDLKKKKLGRSTSMKLRLAPLLCSGDTPRTLIKKIIHVVPPASPVVPDIAKHEEPEAAPEEAQAELPSGGLSNMEEMQLSDLVPEERAVFAPHMNKKTKQLSISEFERAVSQQLVQNQAPSLQDSTLAGSLSMSLGCLARPDTVERRQLSRRPKNHKPLDIKDFEDKVEQDMLRRKAQSYLVDSEMSPGSQATMLTSVGTGKRRTQGYSQDLVLDHEHVDIMIPVSSKSPENPPEGKQDHSQWTNPMDQLSVSEEVVVGKAASSEEEGIAEAGVEYHGSPEPECEIAQGIGAGSLSKHSNPTFEKSEVEPFESDVEEADELQDQPILIELDSLEESTEDEPEDAENEKDFMKTPLLVHDEVHKPPLLTPSPAKPASPEPLLQPQQAKQVPKRSRKKTLKPELPSSLIKSVFKDYAKMPVAAQSFRVVEECTKKYFKNLWSDLTALASHSKRKILNVSDIEVLMRRQKLVTDEMPLHVLIERYLPLEYRKVLIPVAVSGNKVIPETKRSRSRRLRKGA